ncbi:MAG: ABC transporter permease, partial [Pyrinomonadaceae bacterium]
MTKLLAIIKREYLQRVRTKMFVIMTVLGPVMLAVFTIVPGLLFSMKAGGATRIAIVDQTPDARVFKALSDSFLKRPRTGNNDGSSALETINANTRDRAQSAGKALNGNFAIDSMLDMHGRSLDQVKQELNGRIARNQLDGYLILPADILTNNTSRPEYYGRNVGDVITSGQIEDRIDRAVRTERLVAAGIKEQSVEDLSRPVDLATYPVNDKGEVGAKDSGAGFLMVFIIGFLIYITIIMYGQVILGAVVEEK